MIDRNLLITASAVVLGLIWLGAWLLGKIRRGEIEIGAHSVLLVLLAAILLVPFAVNVAGHLIANSLHDPSGAVSKWSNLQAIVFDFPMVCEIANEFISQHGMRDRIRTCEGDMWRDELPAADLHFYSTVYNDWPPEKCGFLTAKSFSALPSGGRIIIHGILYNDEKSGPFAAAAFSMLMMGWTEGKSYSSTELFGMLSDAGFCDIEVRPAFGYYSISTGLKPL